MNIRISRILFSSCMYCLGEFSRMVGTFANMFFFLDRDFVKSSNKFFFRVRFLRKRNSLRFMGYYKCSLD